MPKFMDALGEISDDEEEEEEEAEEEQAVEEAGGFGVVVKRAPAHGVVKKPAATITYEDLRARSYGGGETLLAIPQPKDDTYVPEEPAKPKEEEEDEVFLNPFGKWEKSKSKKRAHSPGWGGRCKLDPGLKVWFQKLNLMKINLL